MNKLNFLADLLTKNNLKISTVESCTGGLLSSKLTDISGSSNFITLNLITYSNEAKKKFLNVTDKILKENGAVSEECAFQMAKGLYDLTKSDICVSTTGIAGPTGGSTDKPVGLMYSTIYSLDKSATYKILVNPNESRVEIKNLFTNKVLENLIAFIQDKT
ncbi:CinA family protein [bacterium]|nr:CinA family protein [bacterium]